MVIDMDETRLRSIEQLQNFLNATPEVAFTASEVGGAADNQRYEHKVVKRYRHADVKTPLAALNELCGKGLARLKEGVTLAALQAIAQTQTDLAAAQEMQRAKAELFRLFNAPRGQPTKAA